MGAAFAIAPTVSVVIPGKNEARNLPIVFRTVPAWVDEVVLVDGRSVDDTLAVARQCRPDVKIVNQAAQGKGDALRAGFEACSGDIIVMIDGDGSTDGAEITRFVAALRRRGRLRQGITLRQQRRQRRHQPAPANWATGCCAAW